MKTSTSNNQDGDEVYTGTFLKDGTINQPIVLNNDWDRSKLNRPGTYHNSVTFYYNDKKIDTVNFDVTVPHDQASAKWDYPDDENGGYPIPASVTKHSYNEKTTDYYMVGGEDHHYTYQLTVTPNQTALDAGGTTVEIPLAQSFNVGNVTGSTNYGDVSLKANQDYSYAIANHVLTISMTNDIHKKLIRSQDVQFDIIGHYDDNTSSSTLVDFPSTESNLSSDDGTGTVISHFAGIGGKILSDSSLANIPAGNIYTTDIKAYGDPTNDSHTHNPYYLSRGL